MLDTINNRLRRLTYWQWAMVGIVVLLLVSTHWAWSWHCSSMAYRRLAQKYPQNSEKVWLVPQWLQHPQWERAKWYVKRPTGFHLNFRRIDDAVLRDLQSLPTIRSLTICNEDPFQGIVSELPTPADASDLNAVVQRIARLRHLELLHFYSPSISEADLEELSQLPHLEVLSLVGSNLSDLSALPRLQRLKSLSLTCDSITATGWKHVSEVSDLESLILWGMTIPAADFQHLGACRKLKTLTLLRTNVSSDCWRVIAQLTALEELHMTIAKIAEPERNQIPQLPKLWLLDLTGSDVVDESLVRLAECPGLTELRLLKTPVTDAVIPHLLRIPNLKTLDLRWTNVTKAGSEEFSRARPEVTLRWEEKVTDEALLPKPVDEPQ